MKEKYLGETGVATLVDYINNNLDLKVNLSDIATVATSGSYNDLIDKPTIPQGTVTSIGLSAPTGFSVSGSPVTSSGTLTLAFASGYSLPTTTKQGQWDSAYSWGNHANAGYCQVTWVLLQQKMFLLVVMLLQPRLFLVVIVGYLTAVTLQTFMPGLKLARSLLIRGLR